MRLKLITELGNRIPEYDGNFVAVGDDLLMAIFYYPTKSEENQYIMKFHDNGPWSRQMVNGKNRTINDYWSISLESSHRNPHMPTKRGTPGPIYIKALSIIQKFIDEYTPEAVACSGATDEMDLVYNRMFERYMGQNSGRDEEERYVRYGLSTFLRPDVAYGLLPYDTSRADAELARLSDDRKERNKKRYEAFKVP